MTTRHPTRMVATLAFVLGVGALRTARADEESSGSAPSCRAIESDEAAVVRCHHFEIETGYAYRMVHTIHVQAAHLRLSIGARRDRTAYAAAFDTYFGRTTGGLFTFGTLVGGSFLIRVSPRAHFGLILPRIGVAGFRRATNDAFVHAFGLGAAASLTTDLASREGRTLFARWEFGGEGYTDGGMMTLSFGLGFRRESRLGSVPSPR